MKGRNVVTSSALANLSVVTSMRRNDGGLSRAMRKRRHGQASLYRLVEITQQLLERISLRRTPGDGRDLGPKSTFFRLVNDYL